MSGYAQTRLGRAVEQIIRGMLQKRQDGSRAVVPACVEVMEGRQLLAAVAWTGSGGDLLWENGLNWSSGNVPSEYDDVTVDVPEATTIQFASAGTRRVRSLQLAEELNIAGGTLTIGTGTGMSVLNGASRCRPGR